MQSQAKGKKAGDDAAEGGQASCYASGFGFLFLVSRREALVIVIDRFFRRMSE